jgi:hypothetical protein
MSRKIPGISSTTARFAAEECVVGSTGPPVRDGHHLRRIISVWTWVDPVLWWHYLCVKAGMLLEQVEQIGAIDEFDGLVPGEVK